MEMQCVYCEVGAVIIIIGATSNRFGTIYWLVTIPRCWNFHLSFGRSTFLIPPGIPHILPNKIH